MVRMILCILCMAATTAFGQTPITLKVSSAGQADYQNDVVKQALEAAGYTVTLQAAGEFSGTKLEAMLASGTVTFAVLGETASRNERFIPIRVQMTNGLIGKRILFIPKGSQGVYDKVKTLADFQKLGKTAGMGKSWADMEIWKTNGLKATGIDGEWQVLYNMVAAGNRGIDYLPRGAAEMIEEAPQHPELELEKNLVLVYQKDQILYLAPTEAKLKPILEKALKKAEASGLMKKLVAIHYRQIFMPPIDLNRRTVINLRLP